MNRRAFFLTLFSSILLFSCKSEIRNQSKLVLVELQQKSNLIKEEKINIELSKIYWKGTKMRGLGKHEGEIKLNEGYFLIEENKIIGGKFTINMNSINVTDIPKHETIPRRNLNNHLKSDDFFAVSKYPFALFEIETINSNEISGVLTIRDVSKKIQVQSSITQKDNKFKITASFSINRFEWNVGYTGSWIDKTLVDKNIQFTVEIVN
jgi:polyisoprenoid-binding protein YceI